MKKLFNFSVNTAISLALLLILANIAFGVDTAKVKVIDTAGCNIAIVEETDTNTYSLESTSGAHNWFAGVLEGLDTSNPTTFSLCMDGTGTPESPGDVSKWDGLWPVYTYGKYWDYNTYIYYTKNADGYWVSSDIFAKDKLAGNGKTPEQKVILTELSEEFLSEDGNYWSAWQEIQDTKINVGSNIFTLTKQFNSPNTSLAMRIPYTYDYEYEYMKKLKQANVSGVTVHEIGKSIRNHNLYVVEVSDSTASEEELKDRRVVLMYANEDGDEPDGCWVVNGAMNHLIQGIQNNDKEVKKILSEVTFLFIPLLDPVGWSNSTYGDMTYVFDKNKLFNVDTETREITDVAPRPEVVKYMKLINNWIGDIDWLQESGKRLDVVVNLHNIECNEGENIFCPIVDNNQSEFINGLNKVILSNLVDVQTSETVWLRGFATSRLMSWCSEYWGSIQAAYEINSRYPQNRLSLYDLDKLGKSLVCAFDIYLKSDAYEKALPYIEKQVSIQKGLRNRFWEKSYMFDTYLPYYTMIGY